MNADGPISFTHWGALTDSRNYRRGNVHLTRFEVELLHTIGWQSRLFEVPVLPP